MSIFFRERFVFVMGSFGLVLSRIRGSPTRPGGKKWHPPFLDATIKLSKSFYEDLHST